MNPAALLAGAALCATSALITACIALSPIIGSGAASLALLLLGGMTLLIAGGQTAEWTLTRSEFGARAICASLAVGLSLVVTGWWLA